MEEKMNFEHLIQWHFFLFSFSRKVITWVCELKAPGLVKCKTLWHDVMSAPLCEVLGMFLSSLCSMQVLSLCNYLNSNLCTFTIIWRNYLPTYPTLGYNRKYLYMCIFTSYSLFPYRRYLHNLTIGVSILLNKQVNLRILCCYKESSNYNFSNLLCIYFWHTLIRAKQFITLLH